MKSESIHRVAAAFGVQAHYDSKIKTWKVGSQVFTVAEMGKLQAGGLRKLLDGVRAVPAPKKPKRKTAGRKLAFADDAKITVIAAANPKRAGTATHAQFAQYRTGMTVAECRKLGITAHSLRWDVAHGFISVQ